MNKPVGEKNIDKSKFKKRICQDCPTSIKDRRSNALRCVECVNKLRNITNRAWQKANPKKHIINVIRTYIKFIETHPVEAKIARKGLVV